MQLFCMLVVCLNSLFLFRYSIAAARVHIKDVEHNEHAKSKDLASINYRAPIQRRAGQNRLGGSRTEDAGDGWLARYQPLEALIPSQQSAASLESFYTSLKEDLTTMMQEGVAPTHAIEASDGETELIFNANGIVPWPVAMKFCDWILAKTKRGWTGRYRVSWENPETRIVITITLVVAGLFGVAPPARK